MAERIIEYPFLFGDTVFLLAHLGRPYVPIAKLAENLGMDPKRQAKRCRQYRYATGFQWIDGQLGPSVQQYAAIPLENLAWFLFTLRPTEVIMTAKLRSYCESLPHALFYWWQKNISGYSPARTIEKIICIASRPLGPAKPTARITEETVKYIQAQKAAGRTYADIAIEIGYSRAAVSMAARGLYPCIGAASVTPETGQGSPQTT